MSPLVLLPCRVTPGTLVGEFRSSSGVFLSHSGVSPVALASHVNSRSLAQSCYSWSSCPVMELLSTSRVVSLLAILTANLIVIAAYSFRPVLSLLELLPSHVTTGALAQSSPFLSARPVMSLLELLPSPVTFGALAQSCHSWSSCRGFLLLELLSSHVTPGAVAQSRHSWSSCRVVSLLELLPANYYVPAVYCFRPVVSLLELLSSHVARTALAQS